MCTQHDERKDSRGQRVVGLKLAPSSALENSMCAQRACPHQSAQARRDAHCAALRTRTPMRAPAHGAPLAHLPSSAHPLHLSVSAVYSAVHARA